MQNRRETLKQSALVAALLASTGLFPQFAHAFNKSAFEAKNLADALKSDGKRRCYPMLAPTVPHQRLTMSRALLASAKHTVLSISGQSKLTTLNTALAGDDVAEVPMRAFLQPTLEIYWCP